MASVDKEPLVPALSSRGSTIASTDLKWLRLAPKIWIKLIKLDDSTGAHTVIIRAEAGGVLPRHRHVDSAEIFVIRGSGAHPQTGKFNEQDFIQEHQGAIHDPLVFDVETELLMIAKGPSVFIDDDGTDLYTMDVPMLRGLEASQAD